MATGATPKCKDSGCKDRFARKPADGQCAAHYGRGDWCYWHTAYDKTVCNNTACQTGYQQVEDLTCLECPEKGNNCETNGTAYVLDKQCLDGYVQGEGTCFKCPNNCASCSFITNSNYQTECKTCINGFTLRTKDKTCHQCPNNCNNDCTYNEDPSKLRVECNKYSCLGGYVNNFDDGKCTSCKATNCTSCTTNSTHVCKPGGCKLKSFWVYSNGEGTCLPCPDKCYRCNSTTSCLPQGCMPGTVRDEVSGDCIACQTGCEKCRLEADRSTTTCLTCMSTHAPDNPTTISVCHQCEDGCTSCTYVSAISSTSCTTCSNVFYDQVRTVDGVDQTYCAACGDFITRCSNVGGIKYIDTCQVGYGKYPADGVAATGCQRCGDNCAECTLSGPVGHVNHNKCELCNLQNVGYYLNTGVCKACPGNCVTCQGSKPGCTECASGYMVKQDTDNHYKCEKCSDPACIKCDSVSTTCEDCLNTHYLDNGACKPCHTGCDDCQAGGKCASCVSGMKLVNNSLCSTCPDNCKTCKDSHCDSCDAHWVVNKGKCGFCPHHCHDCTLTSSGQTQCKPNKCKPGYGLRNGTCDDCVKLTGVQHCSSCSDLDANNKSECYDCTWPRYTLSDDNTTCFDCNGIPGCVLCLDRPQICKKCKHKLERNTNETACGAKCYVCLHSDCPLEPSKQDVTDHLITEDYCYDDCVILTEYDNAGKKDRTALKRIYGCRWHFPLNETVGTSNCRGGDKRLCSQRGKREICCAETILNFLNAGANVTPSLMLPLLLCLTYLLMRN